MSKPFSVIPTSTGYFQNYWDAINALLTFANNEVVTANSLGALTSGNGFVNGYFGANVVVASNIAGGNVTNRANVVFTTNAVFNNLAFLLQNVSVNATVLASSLVVNGATTLAQVGTGNLTVTGTAVVSGNASAPQFSAPLFLVGNSTSNAVVTGNTYSGTSNNSLYLGGQLPAYYQTAGGLAANVFTMTSNNSTYFGGQLPAYYANVTSPSFTTSLAVGTSVVNTTALSIGNSTVNTVVNSTSLTTGNLTASGILAVSGNAAITGNLVVNGSFFVAGSFGYSNTITSDIIPGGSIYNLGNTTNRWILWGNNAWITGNVTANVISVGNSTINSVVNSTAMVVNSVSTTAMNVTTSITYGPNGDVQMRTLTTNTTGTSAQVVDSYPTTYRTAKYVIQVVDNTANNRYASEILLMHDDTVAQIVEYGQVTTNTSVGVFTGNVSAGIVQLVFTPVPTASTVKLIRTLLSS